MKNVTLLSSLVLSAGLSSLTGCGLLVTEFEGEFEVRFQVDAEGNQFGETVLVDPADNPDVQEHADMIQSGEITEIVFTVERVAAHNQALSGSGEVYARLVGDEWLPQTPENAIATFQDTPVEVGSSVTLAITAEQVERINALVFPENG